MNLEIRHLKRVEAVAETGSVTRAGHGLQVASGVVIGVPLQPPGYRWQ